MLFHRYRRTAVRTVSNFQAFPCRSEHHIRRIYLSVCLDCLAFLQRIPVFQRNFVGFCLLHGELSAAMNLYGITVTGYVVIYPKCCNFITIDGKCLFLSLNLFADNRKWEFRCDRAEGMNHPFKSFRSDQGQRFCTFCISHGQ